MTPNEVRFRSLLMELVRAPWCHVYDEAKVWEAAKRGETVTALRVQLTYDLVMRIREAIDDDTK